MSAMIFTLLIGAILLILFDDVNENQAEYIRGTIQHSSNENNIITDRQPCSKFNCIVNCVNTIPEDNLSEIINNMLGETCTCIDVLTLNNPTFDSGELSSSWLFELNRSIEKLKIEGGNIKEIKSLAFYGTAFNRLRYLELINLDKLSTLHRGSFKNLQLLHFTLRFSLFNVNLRFPTQVFDGMTSLTNAQIQRCVIDDNLGQIVGESAADLNNLQLIDLRFNQISSLPTRAFYNARSLQSIYLNNNKIHTVDFSAFKILPWLKLLHLDDNDLTTLPAGVFDDFREDTKLYAHNNKWECNCDLQWFKDFFLESSHMNKSLAMTCDNSPNFERFEYFDFGCDGVIPSRSMRTVSCLMVNDTMESMGVGEYDEFMSVVLNLTVDDSILMQLNDLHTYDETRIEVKLSTEATLSDYVLIWFRSRHPEHVEVNCYSNLRKSQVIYNLDRSIEYTVCLMYAKQLFRPGEPRLMSAPFECMGILVPPSWENQPWITNAYRIVVAVLCTIVLIITIIVTSVVTFCVIRHYPKLLRGNRRIVIVESQSADVLVMPPTYGDGETGAATYRAPSFISSCAAHDGYLHTGQQSHTYAEVNYFRPPVLQFRSGYDVNGGGGGISINNVMYSAPRGDMLERRSRRISIVTTKSSPQPPPLPPPNQDMEGVYRMFGTSAEYSVI